MTKTAVVLSVSLGTALLMLVLTCVVVVGIALSAVGVHARTSAKPDVFRPRTGVIGELEHELNDLQYGPVNASATREVKNGLFDRIRANRQSRCAPQERAASVINQCPPCSPMQTAYSFPLFQPDVNRSQGHQSTTSSAGAIVSQFGEYPIATPINQIETATTKDCPSCKTSRNAVKTGSFICSNCRRSQVGNWHTDWNADGTPVTFLCESCHSIMTPEQRQRAFTAYHARQSSKTGPTGLIHQEIGE